MAVLISRANNNLTASATWALVDSTSLLDSEAGSDTLTTAYSGTRTAAFTPGAIVVDGIAVKPYSVAASPSGTISVHIALNSDHSEVAGTEVTINVADLPTIATPGTTNEGGWVLFKLASPVTLLAATAYELEAKTSVASQVALNRNATTDNFSRLLRTTTTQAPVATDVMHVMGEHTGAGTGNDITVTMDQTASTDYGAGTDSVVALTVNKRGNLNYAYAASTNYYLKLSGDAIVYNGGTFTIGTVANPIPRTGTAVLEFDPVADGGMGLIARNGSTLTIQGLSRTSGKNVIACKLNTDEAANSTSLGVDTDTGWLDNDVIVAGKTQRSGTNQIESGTMNGAATADTLTVDGFAGTGGGIQYAKSGTSPTQCHIGLITRNVMFRSATSTLMTYLNVKATSTVDIDWCDFRYIGENATGKKGIEVETTTGSFNMQYSTIRDTEDQCFITTGTTTNNITVSNNVWYNVNNIKTAGIYPFVIAATSGTSWTVTYNYFFGCSIDGTSRAVVQLNDVGGNFSYNVFTGTISGNSISTNEGATIGTFSNNEIYGEGSGYGIIISANGLSGTMTNNKSWRNWLAGFNINAVGANLNVNNFTVFGNQTQNIYVATAGSITFNNLATNGDSSAATTSGVNVPSNAAFGKLTFVNCNFSQTSGILTAHTNDLRIQGSSCGLDILFDNCLFGASTLVNGYSNLINNTGIIKFNKYNQTTNKHLWYGAYGIAQATGTGLTDTNVRTASSLALRIAPENSSTGFSWSFKILARASTYVGVGGYIQKNAAFGTDLCTVDLYLPGSTTPDATYTMPNDTNWNVFNLAANYTGTVDLYATVTITAKSATASAYIYVDDIYNGTNKITALDVWDQGQPSPIMYEELGDAAGVWAVLQSTQTTAGTMGNRLKSALTTPLFIALK